MAKYNTRTDDIEKLDQSRQEVMSEEAARHREALLVNVYEQSKDVILERKRQQLTELLRRMFTEQDPIKQAKYRQRMDKIRQEVEDYVQSPSYKRNMAKKIEQAAGYDEALKYWERG